MYCIDPGVFEFEKPSFLIKESVGVAQIPVTRVNGCDGRVAVHWSTKDLTAVTGQDYTGGEGSLVFEHGETAKMIDIAIMNDLVRRSMMRSLCQWRNYTYEGFGENSHCNNVHEDIIM